MIPTNALFIFPFISYTMLFFSWTTLQLKLIEMLSKTSLKLEDTTPMFWVSSIVTPAWVTFLVYQNVL